MVSPKGNVFVEKYTVDLGSTDTLDVSLRKDISHQSHLKPQIVKNTPIASNKKNETSNQTKASPNIPKFCTGCGWKHGEADRFCGGCGAKRY